MNFSKENVLTILNVRKGIQKSTAVLDSVCIKDKPTTTTAYLEQYKNALFLKKFLNDHHLNDDTQGVLYSYILQMMLSRILQSKKSKNTSLKL